MRITITEAPVADLMVRAGYRCWADTDDADECAMERERSVAGKSDDIPECPVHGLHPDEEVS